MSGDRDTFRNKNIGHTSTRKGRMGELLVIQDLLNKGYDVYTPVVDDNGVDLIVMRDSIAKKVQVKSHDNPSRRVYTSIEINTRLCNNADIIAIPVRAVDCICYVNAKDTKRAFTIAYLPGLNGQTKGRNWYTDYLEFPWD